MGCNIEALSFQVAKWSSAILIPDFRGQQKWGKIYKKSRLLFSATSDFVKIGATVGTRDRGI